MPRSLPKSSMIFADSTSPASRRQRNSLSRAKRCRVRRRARYKNSCWLSDLAVNADNDRPSRNNRADVNPLDSCLGLAGCLSEGLRYFAKLEFPNFTRRGLRQVVDDLHALRPILFRGLGLRHDG